MIISTARALFFKVLHIYLHKFAPWVPHHLSDTPTIPNPTKTILFMKTTVLLAVALMASTATIAQETTPQPLRSQSATLPMKSAKKIPASEWKYQVSESDIIRETPDGNRNMWSKASSYYGNSLFGVVQGSSSGMPCSVVESTDGKNFYIYDPFAMLDTKSWLKAEIDGDKMTVNMPQAIYADSDGDENYVYVAQLCHFEYDDPQDPDSEGLYYAEEGNTQIVFLKEGDKWVMQPGEEVNGHPLVMGLVSADDGMWCIYSDWAMSFTPFAADLVTLPVSTNVEDWNMIMASEGEYVAGRAIQVGFDNNDVYVKGLSEIFPESWVKGTLADGNVTFLSEQYMGASELDNCFGYFYGAIEEEVYLEEWDIRYMQTVLTDQVVFAYDPENHRLTTADAYAINRGKDETYIMESTSKPILNQKSELTDYTPASPVPAIFNEAGDYMGSFYFTFPSLNKDMQVLPTDELFYRVYVDGEVFELYSDEYAGIEDGTTEIPFSFSNGNTLGCFGIGETDHYFMFNFTGFDTMDVQTLCIHDGKEYASPKISVFSRVKADTIGAETPVTVEWYDIAGRRVSDPVQGLYLRRTVYADGKAETSKVMMNKR